MEKRRIDLHVHSNCSDGTMTPSELVAYAQEKNLAAFALTDHDTVKGLKEAMEASRGIDVEVIAGIEFSTNYHGQDVHIVGLDIGYEDAKFLEQTEIFRDARNIRNEKMIRRMQEDGIDISKEQMKEAFQDAIWTRAHFARYLTEHGYAKDMQDAFTRFLGDHGIYFVPREKATPAQAVELIFQSGGIPILAHPLLYHLDEPGLCKLFLELKNAGLIGVEALYSTHSQKDENLVRHLAKCYNLKISGGSDFHGSNKPGIDLGCGRGALKIPYEVLEGLRERREKV